MAIRDTSRKPYIEDNDTKIKIGLDTPIRRGDEKDGFFASTSTTIGETNAEFQFTFKIENLSKLMLKDYNVTISSKGLSKFSSQDGIIEYFVAVEATSSYFNA